MSAYVKSMVLLTLIALLMSVKDMAILVTMVTLGLGLPFVFAATAVLYGLCLYPAVAWGGVRGWAATAVLVAIAATAPSLIARGQSEGGIIQLRKGDHGPARPVTARTIEIRRPADNYGGIFSGNGACGDECRALLTSGKADWVRVVMIESYRARERSRGFYKADSACGASTEAGVGPGCVVEADDPGTPAALIMTFSAHEQPGSRDSKAALISWSSVQTVRAMQGSTEELHQTSATLSTPMMPTVIGPDFRGMSSGGLGLMRMTRTINGMTLGRALAMLGYDIAGQAQAVAAQRPRSWRDSITPEMTREVLAVLDLKQTAQFSPDQAEVVNTWTMHARQVKEWTPELIAVLRRIVHEQRMPHASFFDQVFERNPTVTAALLPDVIAELEKAGADEPITAATQAAYTFTRLAPDLMVPYGARLMTLVARGGKTRDILLPAVGRWGIDPVPFLVPITTAAAARGACFAEPRWGPQLIPALRTALTGLQGRQRGSNSDYRDQVAKALAKLGDNDFVDREMASGRYEEVEHLRRRLARRGSRSSPDELCYH